MSLISVFVAGADTLGYLVVALLFLCAWKRTRDALLAFFSAAFVLLALNEFALVMERADGAGTAISDVLRFAAFALALAAIGYRQIQRQRL